MELQAELDRADVVAPEEIPPNVVTMNSTVKFLIVETGRVCLTLVYPRDMDGSADKISILAPWAVRCWAWRWATELAWPGPGGKAMTVQVKGNRVPARKLGRLHR